MNQAARLADPAVLRLAGKIRYVIDPDNEYPRNFTGQLRATLRDGRVIELRQPHMRGGALAPLPDAELERKFLDNVRHGDWNQTRTDQLATWTRSVLTAPTPIDLTLFRG